jgi:hypothetical protein
MDVEVVDEKEDEMKRCEFRCEIPNFTVRYIHTFSTYFPGRCGVEFP